MSNTSPLRLMNGENLIGAASPGVTVNSSISPISLNPNFRTSEASGGFTFRELRSGSNCVGSVNTAADFQADRRSISESSNTINLPGSATAAMVAAMNEHLSSSSATNSVRTTSTSTNAHDFRNVSEDSKAGILGFPEDFDHMYASMTDGEAPVTATSALGVSPLRGNEAKPNDLTEVKHLKELLLLHLDLIQQQSEQIVTKDKLLAANRQEIETLKLRLERMERRVSLQKHRVESTENSIVSDRILGPCSPPSLNLPSLPSTSEHQKNIQPESVSPQYNDNFKIRLNTVGGIPIVKQELNNVDEEKHDINIDSRHDWEAKKKRRSDPTPVGISGKRKRGASCSSANLANDQCPMVRDSKSLSQDGLKKCEKKLKSLLKKDSFLTTDEHYFTAVGDLNYSLSTEVSSPQEDAASLEVPNWRIKVYTSCYTMEGTENLDDEIFNKRHLKLENDERRRKRWDVQRIREQRHIEKLKQRQERQNHQATCYNTNHVGPCSSSTEEEIVKSLWPDVEQMQSLQVDTQLPVTAFGAAIPSFTLSDFSLPWLDSIKSKARRHQRVKRSTGRRKSCRR